MVSKREPEIVDVSDDSGLLFHLRVNKWAATMLVGGGWAGRGRLAGWVVVDRRLRAAPHPLAQLQVVIGSNSAGMRGLRKGLRPPEKTGNLVVSL